MKKNLLLVLLSVFFCFMLVGCGGGTDSSSSGEIMPLEIVDSGYSYEDGYIYYSIKIENPNSEVVAEYPSFRIVARDADGNVLGTEEQTLSEIYPGSTAGFAFLGPETSSEPDTVEFELIESDDLWIAESDAVYPGFIELSTVNVNATQDELGGMSYSGEIVNTNEFDIDSAAVCILFKDADGKMIGGDSTFVDYIKANGNTAFTLDVFGDYYTSDYEIFVMTW